MSLILAVDTTAKPVSCALAQDDRVLASYYTHTGLTHSQTLMPMIEHVLHMTGVSIEQVDALAVNVGPGSFTGVRIGVSAVKGLAFAHEKPCVPVSTLCSIAENIAVLPGAVICAAMDARCQQVYTALFEKDDTGRLVRLSEDEALTIDELGKRLLAMDKPVVLAGDGGEVCYAPLQAVLPHVVLAPPCVRYQTAAATAMLAQNLYKAGETVTAQSLLPVYLRLPQAERELRRRQGEGTPT